MGSHRQGRAAARCGRPVRLLEPCIGKTAFGRFFAPAVAFLACHRLVLDQARHGWAWRAMAARVESRDGKVARRVALCSPAAARACALKTAGARIPRMPMSLDSTLTPSTPTPATAPGAAAPAFNLIRPQPYTEWAPQLDAGTKAALRRELEQGAVLFFPNCASSSSPAKSVSWTAAGRTASQRTSTCAPTTRPCAVRRVASRT